MADHLFGITDAGRVRENNEDVFIAEEILNGQFLIAGVIDGVGGYEGGEVAAAVTKEVVLGELAEIGTDVITQLSIAFNLANEEVLAKKLLDVKLADMACVATVAVIDRQNNQFHYIHVGDTRLYLFRDNSLVKISHDQSFVGFLEDSGRLTEEAAMQHPKRNQINQAIGLSSHEELTDAYFETGSSPFLPNDIILICSDGLTDLVPQATITAVLSSDMLLETKCQQLVEAANLAGGKDNITVVLVKNDKVPVLHDISRPVTEPVIPVIASTPDRLPDFSAVPVTFAAASPVENMSHKARNSSGLIMLLSSLCLLFLGTSLWLFFRPAAPPAVMIPAVIIAKTVLNPAEKTIQDNLLKLKGDTLVLSETSFKGPVKLSEALKIDKDTLYIKTKGKVVLQPDSAYKGPALLLSPNCKHIVIDHLVIENFDTGIISYKNAADLKNVKFNHCKYPLQVLFEFPDHSLINGRMSKRPYLADSLERKL